MAIQEEGVPGYRWGGATEVLSMPKRTETPGSRKLCAGCGRHQEGKEKNTRTEQKKEKEKREREQVSPQPSGNGSVFP